MSEAKTIRASLKKEPENKAEQIREQMQGTDVSQYSPAVMQNKALLMLATEDNDSLYDVSPEQIPYISYLRAIDSRLQGGIPGTLLFIQSQLSLSRSRDRKGRIEFGQALNKQSVITPQYMPGAFYPGGYQPTEQKPSLLSRILSKKKGDEKNA